MRKPYVQPETIAVSMDCRILCSSNTSSRSNTQSTTRSTAPHTNPTIDAVNGLYSGMTLRQKAAVMNLMMALAGAGPDTPEYIAQINKLMSIEGAYLQITSEQYKSYTESFGGLEGLVNELKGIHDKSILETLFLSFFSIVAESKSERALVILLHVYSELGFSEEDCYKIIQKAEALSNMMM